MAVTLNKSYISLPVRESVYLTADKPVTWSSDNLNVLVDQNGRVIAPLDVLYPDSKAIITATDIEGNIATCEVTVVNWMANKTNLEIVVSDTNYYYLTKEANGDILAVKGAELFRSTDNMVTLNKICDLPGAADIMPILITPFGYFIRTDRYGAGDKIYRSTDLINWTLSFTMQTEQLCNAHQFDSYYDELNETLYVYVAEYSGSPVGDTERHKVYRGTITATTENWETILDFYSVSEYNADKTKSFYASHVHCVIVDQQTGHVWVGTGDADSASRILYSIDNGTTFTILGMGNQEWRCLAIWFTENYIYWNMDTGAEAQKIFRISRSAYNDGYPVITSQNDYRELVAILNNGSLWFRCYVKDGQNNDIVLIGSAAEGKFRDWRARVYALKENSNGTVEVQEILSMASNTPFEYQWQTRLEPIMQDDNGYIYLRGYSTEIAGLLKAQLSDWVSGYVVPPFAWQNNFAFVNSFKF